MVFSGNNRLLYPNLFYVSGIISHSTQAINDILTNNFNNVHIVIENGAPTESSDRRTDGRTDRRTDGQMFVQLASKSNVEVCRKETQLSEDIVQSCIDCIVT